MSPKIYFKSIINPKLLVIGKLLTHIDSFPIFPIATEFHDKDHGERQPRLLVFSVDVAEGVTVTFDSYPKAAGSRK